MKQTMQALQALIAGCARRRAAAKLRA